jgi:hypothetical protein
MVHQFRLPELVAPFDPFAPNFLRVSAKGKVPRNYNQMLFFDRVMTPSCYSG